VELKHVFDKHWAETSTRETKNGIEEGVKLNLADDMSRESWL
jgi:hypothetical protein